MPVELNLRVGGAECPCAVEAAAGNWALWRCGCLVGPRCPASCKKLGLGVCMNIVQVYIYICTVLLYIYIYINI